MQKVKILKVDISNVSLKGVLEEVKKWLGNVRKKHYIVTPNPEFLVTAQKNSTFRDILNKADLALPDGAGILWASRILGKPLKERVTGVDFMENLCQLAEKEGFRVGLIGGKVGVAEKAAECLKKRYPGLEVVLAAEEWSNWTMGSPASDFFDFRFARDKMLDSYLESSSLARKTLKNQAGDPSTSEKKFLAIQQSSNLTIDILFVAFGAPKQEVWISENLEKLPVKVAMGVGGAFDYLAGVVPRAPRWVQNLGLEWLFRLIYQPRRVRRQVALLEFIYLIFQARFEKIRKHYL